MLLPVIVDCALYRDGKRTEGGGDWRSLRQQTDDAGGAFVWIGMHEPSHEESR